MTDERAEQDVDIEALVAERDEYLDDLKRVAAEFENFRKRAARDQASLVARAAERLVKELLPVLDDLERAAKPPARERGPGEGARGNPSTADEASYESLLEGVRLVHRQLAETLRREGLEEIATDGKFDPHVHEALLSQPADGEEGTVLEVLQKGYRLGDRVLRPARVIVAE